jgi:small subunit ribosomal protein S3
MGQKVHPEAMRVGYIHDWRSHWFSERHFAEYLAEDIEVRRHIVDKLSHAGLSDITIKKNAGELEVNIHTARPGIVIGKSGAEVDALRRDLHRMTKKQIKVNILEIKRPELDAKLVAQSIAEQLQNRVAFRRAMKRALTSAMRSGAKGAKVQVAGRLGGAEMARTESYSDGRVPLHTMRADIDYGFHEARTTFGRIGVKCWMNKGEIMPEGYTGSDLTDSGAPPPSRGERSDRGDRGDRSGGGSRSRGRRGGRSGGPAERTGGAQQNAGAQGDAPAPAAASDRRENGNSREAR